MNGRGGGGGRVEGEYEGERKEEKKKKSMLVESLIIKDEQKYVENHFNIVRIQNYFRFFKK